MRGAQWNKISRNLDHMKVCCQTALSVKLNCWDLLPWKLCGVAHKNEETARRCCKEAIASFDAVSADRARFHHPLAIALLGPGSARIALEQFADGRIARASLPENILEVISALYWIPVVERVVEASHKDVKRALAKITNQAGGARASVAIRHREISAAVAGKEAAGQFAQELERVGKNTLSLVQSTGLGSHPDLEGKRGHILWRACQQAVYRADLDAQYFDLGHATRFHEAVRKAERGKQDQDIVSWNKLLAHHMVHMLRDHSDCLFSVDPAALKICSMGGCRAKGAQQNSQIALPTLDIGAAEIFFFRPMDKNLTGMRTVPVAAAVRHQLPQKSVLAVGYAATALGDGQFALCPGIPGQATAACVLCDFEGHDWQLKDGGLQRWSTDEKSAVCQVRGTLCRTGRLDRAWVSQRSDLIQAMLTDPRGQVQASRPGDMEVLENLRSQDLIERCTEPSAQDMYALTAEGKQQIAFGSFVFGPVPMAGPQLQPEDVLAIPLEEASTLQLLQMLHFSGWVWQKMELQLQVTQPPYKKGLLPKFFFTAGVNVSPVYLQVLLKSEDLFAGGLHALPHGRSEEEYQAILDGGAVEDDLLALLEGTRVPLADGEPPPCKRRKGYLELTTDVEWQHKKPERPQPVAKQQAVPLRQARPRYFERQEGAMCGLHALNNGLGGHTGRRIFTLEHVTDAVVTMQKEFGRDGVEWDIREHVRPGGDYSYALLAWMCQRLQVQSSGREFYKLGEIITLESPQSQNALRLQEAVGGIVHEPQEGNPEQGHWTAFTRGRGKQWFALDSLTGCVALADDQALREHLASKNFATLTAHAPVGAPVGDQAAEISPPPLPAPAQPPPSGGSLPPPEHVAVGRGGRARGRGQKTGRGRGGAGAGRGRAGKTAPALELQRVPYMCSCVQREIVAAALLHEGRVEMSIAVKA